MSTKILMINNDRSRIDFIKESSIQILEGQKYLTLTSSNFNVDILNLRV